MSAETNAARAAALVRGAFGPELERNIAAALDEARREAITACLEAMPEMNGGEDGRDSGWDAAIRESTERIAKLADAPFPAAQPEGEI